MKKKEGTYRGYMLRQKSVPYLFLLPNMVIFVLYIIVPAFVGVYYSFTKFDGLKDPVFIGLDNYVELFTDDPDFLQALWNTIKYVVATVPLTYIVALALAVLITQKIKGLTFFRAAYYWPVMISFIVVGVMWRWIFGDTFGVFNYLLEVTGIGRAETLVNPTFAWWASVFIMVWSRAGYYMIMFVGGLLSIPTELYEAADIDGANKRQKFFRVTLPSLRATSTMVIILSTMTIFKVYPLIVTFTNGGPYDATRFVVQHIYEYAFEYYEIGYASAMSVIMLFVVTIFSGINLFVNRKGSE